MDDDLEAFFDDVDTAVKEVQKEEAPEAKSSDVAAESTDDNDDRPSKRVKVSSKPVKAVVASSVPVISILPAVPPPPPTAPAKTTATQPTNSTAIPAPPPTQPIPTPTNSNDRPHVRSAAGQTWVDPTLTQWPTNDFRLFVGNLPKDLKQHQLEAAFAKYPSFHMARIIYDKPKVYKPGITPEEGISRGYGFVSLLDPKDCAKAIREMDQSWLGSRPIKVKRSEWKDREWKEVKKKEKGGKRGKKGFGL
ncbi:hypothetical protein HJC23_005972 [Cyclotella cryptica]|uniref:RRM domain-containing protein n=1 Tax=Cyclotella cryptica TaxID=29204 RepID=A0ABD3P0T4_9STRA|eukprot:CCRYP_019282-RA/>CCRYP_019282-RA protein AED:0.20 eAED:0.20 QI:130/1/1/1/0/0/2/300/248